MAQVSNVVVERLSPNSNVLLASWQWTKKGTKGYYVRWWYKTDAGKPILGEEKEIPYEPRINEGSNCQYTIPDGAVLVWFHVKPKGVKKADWSTQVEWKDFTYLPPTPSAPTVNLVYRIDSQKYELTCEIENYDDTTSTVGNVNGTKVKWEFYRDDALLEETQGLLTATKSCDSAIWTDPGHSYKVRCQVCRPYSTETQSGYRYSEWSSFSSSVVTIPVAPSAKPVCKAKTKTSIYLTWNYVKLATGYDIEYATKKDYFDNTSLTETISSITTTDYEVTGLETGSEYFFRIRAVNNTGGSEWTEISSAIVGSKPSSPTTWSSSTTASVGDNVELRWMHNSVDGSRQRYAQIKITANGSTNTVTQYNSVDPESEDPDETQKYVVNTSSYRNGTDIEWQVRTSGVLLDGNNNPEYGDWSIKRTVKVYAKPSLSISLTNNAGSPLSRSTTLDGNPSLLTSFPIYLHGSTAPTTQKPIGYHVSITSNDNYETVDNVGNVKMVKTGEEIYSRNIDTTNQLLVEFSAHNLNVVNNASYTITCMAAMDSGLTTDEVSMKFAVRWSDDDYDIDADINVNEDSLVAYVRPYCVDTTEWEEDETKNGQVTFSIYRKEFDGSFVEIATDKTSNDYVVDIHPALDYARYRIVAKSKTTGKVKFYDPDPYQINESAAIIQWDEAKNDFEISDGEITQEVMWSGSMLKLPYNLDVSDSNNPDVSLVEYVGREHPVSYYGTHIGSTSTWNVDIVKDDEETLYMLRRLQRWMGDVYVREPSGSGYWANIKVSFNQKHTNLVIPVTLAITRVEGGV